MALRRQASSTTTERLEMFSDGVIAIAITLLVLQIKVPDSTPGELFGDLVDNWPSYVAYILSFVVIGIMWVSHHSMFDRIKQVDRPLLFLNLGLLLGIAYLPFPTALLAQYVREGGTNAGVAAAIYSSVMALIGVGFTLMWYHLYRRPELLVDGIQKEMVGASIRKSLVSPVVYGASVGLAFISAEACFVVYGLVAIYFARGPSARMLTPTSSEPEGG